jgi:dipeptidyl aminopeptidase/acylaminoacyl peptidase
MAFRIPSAVTRAAAFVGVGLLAASVAPAADRFTIERYLNIRSASAPKLSVDNRSVYFLTNITGTNQVWRVPAEGGWPDQLTSYEDAVSGFFVSPVDERICFLKAAGGSERNQIHMISEDRADILPLVENPEVTHYWGGWSNDGTRFAYSGNARNPQYFDPYIFDFATGTSRRVHEADATFQATSFSPKDTYLLLTKYTSNFDQDLYAFEIATGKLTHLTPHTGDVRYSSTEWSPDEKSLYVLTDRDRDFKNLARIDVATAELTYLEDRDWDLEAIDLSKDGRRLSIVTNVDGQAELRILDGGPGGKPLPVPDLPAGIYQNVQFSNDGSLLTFGYTTSDRPGDVYKWDIARGTLTQLTFSSTAGIPRDSFVAPELVHYKSFDGLTIPAWLYLPKEAADGGKAPCIVMMHGGPESQERPDFAPTWQYYLARGYAIFAPNVRGSTGYGKAYSHLDDVEKREDSVKDMAFGVTYLETTGRIDTERLAVYGGSYGGYMVLAGLTLYPELFAAGVDVVGIANYITFLEKTSSYRRQWRIVEYGDPVADREFLTRISPLNRADRIQAPLMVIQGANDPRVPQHEADQMVEAIRARGGDVEYQLYPDEGHGVTKLRNKIDSHPKVADFLDRHVKNRIKKKPQG